MDFFLIVIIIPTNIFSIIKIIFELFNYLWILYFVNMIIKVFDRLNVLFGYSLRPTEMFII